MIPRGNHLPSREGAWVALVLNQVVSDELWEAMGLPSPKALFGDSLQAMGLWSSSARRMRIMPLRS